MPEPSFIPFSVAVVVTLFLAVDSRAATIAVTTTDDIIAADGFCSLREAVTAANSNAPFSDCPQGEAPPVIDVIELPAGTYSLTLPPIGEGDNLGGDLDITEQDRFDYVERDGTRTAVENVTGAQFALRPDGGFHDFHNAPRRQYVCYLTASVEIGLGDGSTHVMEPGDVLLAEDKTGRGHTSRVVKGGMCLIVRIEP